MKKILVDSDIILDVMLDRPLFVDGSRQVLDWAQSRPGSAHVAYHTISNLHYIARKVLGKEATLKIIGLLLKSLNAQGASSSQVLRLMKNSFADFEDALQSAAALACDADYIVTRNIKHYKKSPVKAISPTQFLAML